MSRAVTHGLAVYGAPTASTTIWSQIGGDLYMPAGGPWLIHHLWGIFCHDSAATDQPINPVMRFRSPTGDIIPDPTPCEFPLASTPPGDATNCGTVETPLTLIPVDWLAAGKAAVAADSLQLLNAAADPTAVWGIIFSSERPEPVAYTHCDHVAKDITGSAIASVGTIRLSERASKLRGIYADLNLNAVLGAGEEVLGYITIESSDVDLAPGRFPLSRGFHGSYGTPVNLPVCHSPLWIPLNTDVPGGAKIEISATLPENLGDHGTVVVYIAYE